MLVLVLIVTVCILWVWSRRNSIKDEPPLWSGSKVLIGHALKYAGNSVQLWNTVQSMIKESVEQGGVLKTTIGPRVLYAVSDPEDVTTVANACLQKAYFYEFSKRWVGVGLVTSSGPQWKVHRKLLNPAFNQCVLDSFIDIFNNHSRSFVENLQVEVGKEPFDLIPYTQGCALQMICSTALGVDFRQKNVANIEFVKTLSKMFNLSIIRFQTAWLHSKFLFSLSSLKRKQDECIKILHNFSNTAVVVAQGVRNGNSLDHFFIFSIVSGGTLKAHLKTSPYVYIFHLGHVWQILRQRKKSLFEDKEKAPKIKLFMDLLLELARDSNSFTDQEIREHVDTIIIAGHDTSATVVIYCILLVGSYPRVQKKIHDELKNIFGDEDRDITKQDLTQLVYLEAVIKETMRLFPVVPLIARYLHKDIKLRHCTLLKGHTAILLISGVNRDSMWGPDVEEFRPERWLDPSTLPDHICTSASFSIGRRSCIGKTYAMMSLKIIMAHFCRNYMVHGDHTKLTLKLDVMLKPFSGHHITIEKRNQFTK